jgi:antitoxin HicB
MAAGEIAPSEYPVRLEPDEDGGFVVTFPDFEAGVTQGDTREEAMAQAADLLETMVANYMAEDWDLPDPSTAGDRPLVALAPLVAAQAELFRTMRQAGLAKADLAARLGISEQQVRRIFDIRRAPRLDQIETAMRALGRRLVVTSEAG